MSKDVFKTIISEKWDYAKIISKKYETISLVKVNTLDNGNEDFGVLSGDIEDLCYDKKEGVLRYTKSNGVSYIVSDDEITISKITKEEYDQAKLAYDYTLTKFI